MIAALLVAAAAAGAGTEVGMAGKTFAPGRVTVLAGERVTWTNRDDEAHTATAEDRSFDSGRVAAGGVYSRRFDQPGRFAYRCTLHRFMRGTVEVVAVELRGPAEPVAFGEPAELTGRAPQPGAQVTLERLGRGPVATTVADEEGRFRFTVGSSDGPARYRAGTGGLSSAAAEVAVAPQLRLSARRGRHGVSIRVHVVPAQPRGVVVLERHERERFGFVPLRRLRLDGHSRARAVLHTGRRLRLRPRLSGPVRGYARAVGDVVVVTRAGGARRDGHH